MEINTFVGVNKKENITFYTERRVFESNGLYAHFSIQVNGLNTASYPEGSIEILVTNQLFYLNQQWSAIEASNHAPTTQMGCLLFQMS